MDDKFTYAGFIGLFICALTLFLQFDPGNLYVTHVRVLLYVTSLCIFVPKYYIGQNENLSLYVSVYHQIPAPILPWQLPENFDPTIVGCTSLITLPSKIN